MTGPDLTPTTVRYLFADRWVDREDSRVSGVLFPSGTRVQAFQLAVNLLAIAVWSLREEGLVELDHVKPAEEPKLLGRFAVTVLGGKSAVHMAVVDSRAERPGLEGALLEAAQRRERDRELRQHILGIGLNSGNPWMSVINKCRDEAVDAGILRIEGRLRRRPVIADPSAYAALEQRDAEIAAARTAYKERNADLDAAVFHDCGKAIEWAHKS